MPKKKVEDYVKPLAIKYNITQKQARMILTHAFKQMCKYIENGKDVRIPHFGHIYFDKKFYSKYLHKSDEKINRKSNRPHN
jgi:nucleoid DNA-binding protein